MSQEAVELVIGKALLNAEFRDLLFANPSQALSDFELTPAEKSRLRMVDVETLELLAKTLSRSQLVWMRKQGAHAESQGDSASV